MAKPIRVLLYYKYLPIENAEQFAADHLAFCKSIGLKGRILVADEGINGTVSGDYETTQKYMDYVHSLPGMEDLWFKIDEEEEQAFKKMFVRYKKEIVHLGLEDDNFDSDINPLETTGAYLSPKEFKDALLDEDTVVLDTRNDYEYDLGHFRGAIRPDIRNFRELPQWVRDHKEEFMDKRVVVYCTGGVRCEKFSGWMVREGYKDVGQLHGGIATYGKDPEVQGGLWDCLLYTSLYSSFTHYRNYRAELIDSLPKKLSNLFLAVFGFFYFRLVLFTISSTRMYFNCLRIAFLG